MQRFAAIKPMPVHLNRYLCHTKSSFTAGYMITIAISPCEKAMNKLAEIDGRSGIIAITHKGEVEYMFIARTMDFFMVARENNE